MNVLITGASRGIGKSLAEHFAIEGANLFLCSRNMEKTLAWQQELMRRHDISITSFNADLGEEKGMQDFIEQLNRSVDHIDVLINNAGIYEPGSVHNEPEGLLQRMMNLNLYSAYHITRALLPAMIKRRSGHVFNMSSIAGFQAYANGGAYSISKFALTGFSKNLREEMKPHNIKVTTVYPGATMTSSWDGAGVDPERIMEASDVAKMIVAASKLSPQACVEDILLRPQLGDL